MNPTNNTPQLLPPDMADPIIDMVSNDLQYIGYAPCGTLTSEAKWSIKKIETIGTVTTVEYPEDADNKASNKFEYIWDDRASITYTR